MFRKILFLGRFNCKNTESVFKFLKKKTKEIHYYKSKKLGEQDLASQIITNLNLS